MCAAGGVAVVSAAVTGPDRLVALAGSRLAVTCSTNSTPVDLCWEFYTKQSSIPRTISTGGSKQVYFDIYRVM